MKQAFFSRNRFTRDRPSGEGDEEFTIISGLGDVQARGGGVHALEFLEQVLADEDDLVRSKAYVAFSRTGQSDAARTRVLERLAQEQDGEFLENHCCRLFRGKMHPLMREALKKHPLIKPGLREEVPESLLQEKTLRPGADGF